MYKNNQGHLTIFCIVFVWLRGPPSPVRIMTQVPWFMYQNRLRPSDGIYHPNFVPCFVVLYLNVRVSELLQTEILNYQLVKSVTHWNSPFSRSNLVFWQIKIHKQTKTATSIGFLDSKCTVLKKRSWPTKIKAYFASLNFKHGLIINNIQIYLA